MLNHRQRLSQATFRLRQQSVCMNSAVDAMARAAAKSNPDKMLRCWRSRVETEFRARELVRLSKGTGK